MGVVSGHLPQTPGNGTPEAPLQFPRPSSNQERPLGSDQWLERGLETALQAQMAPPTTGTSPGEQLVLGLTEAVQGPTMGPNGVANPDFTEGNRQKRTRQDSGGASAYTGIPGLWKDYVMGATAPIEAQLGKNEDVLKAYMGLVQACITRIDSLEKTVQALQPVANPAPSAFPPHDVGVSSSPPSPVPKNGLVPAQNGQAPAASGLAPSLIGHHDPPQYQSMGNHQNRASPVPESTQGTTPTAQPIRGATATKSSPPAPPLPPKPAPKSWVTAAGDAQQASVGEWKTVQYGRQKAVPIAPSKPGQPAAKPVNTRSKEERRLIFRRQAPTTAARHDTRDIQLVLNRAFVGAGLPDFIRAVNAGYAASGHLTVLLKEGAPSGLVVPAYNDMLIAAVREVDIAVISVEISEQWQRIKVHGVPIRRYMNSSHGLEMAREEIEYETAYKLKRDPTWLKSPRNIRAGGRLFATMVVTVGSKDEARRMLKGRLRFGGHHYATEAYWDTNPESVCIRCCGIGHASHLECRNSPPRCTICAGDHEALSHGCNVVGCSMGLGKPCQHSQIRCANCNGPHEATSPKCPKIRQARKQAIQQARNQKLQHLIPPNKTLAVIPPRPPPTLEATGSLGTDRPAIEASDDTDTPMSQESC
jgi:hypothetical protein